MERAHRRRAVEQLLQSYPPPKTDYTRLKLDTYHITYMIVEKLTDRSVVMHKVSSFNPDRLRF